jgi:hypothetical protein
MEKLIKALVVAVAFAIACSFVALVIFHIIALKDRVYHRSYVGSIKKCVKKLAKLRILKNFGRGNKNGKKEFFCENGDDMESIIIKGNRKFGVDSFSNYLIQTCRQHKSKRQALAFAFIVYDFDNHTIIDILEKKNYWSTLDKISSKVLSVFYINSRDSYYKKRQEEIYQDELLQEDDSSDEKYISLLVPIKIEPTPTDNAISFIKSEFELDENIKTPFVLFFQIDNDNKISDSFIVGLKQDKLEDAFLELRDIIKNAVESLDKVLPENYKNHQEIFNLIKEGVNSGQFYDFVSKKVKPMLSIERIYLLLKLFTE